MCSLAGEHVHRFVQVFAVTACASASLLIVFRTYVFHVLRLFPGAHGCGQDCYLEQKQDYCDNRSGRVVGQPFVSHL
jgi:hypothetical protein